VSNTKFLVLHEVTKAGDRMRYIAPANLIALLVDAENYSILGGDARPPSGSKTYVRFVDGTGSFVDESLDELQQRLEDARMVL
jgi:hypothetical protein